jgi:hypothetical protein
MADSQASLRSVTLHGPTNFAPIIRYVLGAPPMLEHASERVCMRIY